MSKTARKAPTKAGIPSTLAHPAQFRGTSGRCSEEPLCFLCYEEGTSPLLRKQMEPQRGHGLEEASVSLSDSHNNYFNQILSAQICEVERNGPSRIAGTGSLSPTYPDS